MAFKVIKEDILRANNDVAGGIRAALGRAGVFMVNVISSPGAGKTSLLEKVCPELKRTGVRLIILTGDCFTSRDAERMDALGLPVVQINTGNACHIDAQLVYMALEGLDFGALDLVVVENVGNLVCPAEFDLGEDIKIALLSTAEGHDKPSKYPLLIRESGLAVLNKMDLLEHVDYDLDLGIKSIFDVNPRIEVIKMSCKTGEGIDGFMEWINAKIKMKKERTV
ncbi:MAG: hydrogenase nickel incorporation protein HypB [Candidatus Omnitrophota bacterium]